MDLSESFAPNSEQLTYAEIGDRIVTVTVEKVTPRSDKPKDPAIHFVEFPGKPLLPGVNVGSVLRRAWGTNGREWVGRRMKLYGDPDVYFGKEKLGGVRVSHVSDISGPVSVPRRGKGAHGVITVHPLKDEAPATRPDPTSALIDHYQATFGVTKQQLEARVALPFDEWAPETLNMLRALGGEIKNGTKTVEDEFPGGAE